MAGSEQQHLGGVTMKGPSNERFITSIDVAKYLEDLTKRRGGYWSFNLAYDRDRDGYFRLSVVLEQRDNVVFSKCVRHPKREWSYYPSSLHGSLTACMWDLCFKLDNRLDGEDKLAQASMPF